MKDSVIVGTFLFFALVVVSSDCRRVKRQDLIPFPRVGKRTWNSRDGDVTEPGREMATLMERVLDPSPVRTDSENWAAALSTYLQDSKVKGSDITEGVQTILKSLLGRNTGVFSNFSRGRDLKAPGRVARMHMRAAADPLQSAGFSSLLVENMKDKMPDELSTYLQGRFNNQDVDAE
ncbi:uncharacterized protein [Palaemon carinicauda]|uniref:uncharacterized protein n=1 Tax=Palaemon carinicauda TaxID=392227 RepID=UPI0035B6071D